MRARDAVAVLVDREFRLLWLARSSSGAGDALVPVALAFAVIEGVDGGARELGIVLATASLGRILFTLIGGVWADRFPRRRLMLACDAVRAVVELFTFAMLLAGAMELWLFVVTGVLFGAASAVFNPASTGLVAEIVPAQRLQQANALLSLSRTATAIGGPVIAGILVALVGPAWVFAIDGVTFIVSGLFLLAMRVVPDVRAPAQRFLADLAAGWREVASRSWLWTAFIAFAFSNLANATFFVLGPIVFEADLGGADEWGLAMSIGSAGAFVGGLIALRWRPRRPIAASFAVWSLGGALPPLALLEPLPAAAVGAAVAVWLGSIALGSAIWVSAIQELIPREKLSRVDSYDWLISLVFMPLGFATAGLVAENLGRDFTLIAAAALSFGVHIAVLALPGVRAVRRGGSDLDSSQARAEPT